MAAPSGTYCRVHAFLHHDILPRLGKTRSVMTRYCIHHGNCKANITWTTIPTQNRHPKRSSLSCRLSVFGRKLSALHYIPWSSDTNITLSTIYTLGQSTMTAVQFVHCSYEVLLFGFCQLHQLAECAKYIGKRKVKITGIHMLLSSW